MSEIRVFKLRLIVEMKQSTTKIIIESEDRKIKIVACYFSIIIFVIDCFISKCKENEEGNTKIYEEICEKYKENI